MIIDIQIFSAIVDYPVDFVNKPRKRSWFAVSSFPLGESVKGKRKRKKLASIFPTGKIVVSPSQ